MNAPIHRSATTRLFLSCLPVILFSLSCSKSTQKTSLVEEGHDPINVTIELLTHDDKGLAVSDSVTADHLGQNLKLADTELRILEYWPQAKAMPETDNQSNKESHAVEISWAKNATADEKTKQQQWIYQSKEDGPAGLLEELDVQVRVLPAGSQPSAPGQWLKAAKDTVQFEHQGHFYALPKVGAEIFPGWTIKNIRSYEHALLEENGNIKESNDSNFANRAIEVTLASNEGTVERHLCFLDHPELTKGIHPALLPATRLKGKSASQSRLTARDPIQLPGNDKNRILLSANDDQIGHLTAFIWDHKNNQFSSQQIDSLPAEVKVGDQTLHILQHRNRARAVVKWQQIKANQKIDPKNKDQISSALLVTWLESNHHQKAVLPLGQATPIRIKGQFQTFRYTEGSKKHTVDKIIADNNCCDESTAKKP